MVSTCNRRDFLRRTGVLALAGLTAAGAHGQAAQRPNIVWIYSDDLAQNAVSAYGGRLAEVAPTSNIDRIANGGMRFNNSFVTNSICGPCRAVILTGKHSHLNGFRQNGDRFDGSQQTFPKLLQQNGYQTAMFGKWHLESDPTGFDAWEVLPGQGHYYNPDFITPAGKIQEHGYVTDIITDKALGWLETGRDASKPFMLMVQHKAPHREWEPGPDHLHAFDGVEIPEPDNLFDDYANRGSAAKLQDMSIEKTMTLHSDLKVWPENAAEDPKLKGRWNNSIGRMDPEQRAAWDAAYGPVNKAFLEANLSGKDLVRWKYQRYMKDYLRCVRSVDDNIGRVLDYLAEKGLDKNTIVFFSSDQSFYLGEHGWFDKRFMYEESLRTPLVAMGPGIPPTSECSAMVQNLDMAETFLELAGTPVPEDMQGASLATLLKGETPATWRDALYYHYYEGEGKVHNVYRHYGVRTERFKLIYFYTLGEWEFYDLKRDPAEMQNQYGNPEYEAEIQQLRQRLDELRALYGDNEPLNVH
jgi:arylsulfatase A-like enzyme